MNKTLVVPPFFSLSSPCSLERMGDFLAIFGLKSPLPSFSFSDSRFYFPIKWFLSH